MCYRCASCWGKCCPTTYMNCRSQTCLSTELLWSILIPHRKKQLKQINPWLGVDLLREQCITGLKAKIIPAGHCCKGDIAMIAAGDGINYCCGHVWLHFQIDGGISTMVEFHDVVGEDRMTCTVDWQASERLLAICTQAIIAPVTYSPLGDRTIRTIIPWKLRAYRPMNE